MNPEDPNVGGPREEPVPDQNPLPPRMRERLEARERRAGKPRGGGAGLTLLVLLLLVAAGGFVWWRSYQSSSNIAARRVEQPASAVPDLTNEAFGVSVGHFASEDQAIGERDRLTGATHLPVSVGQSSGSSGGVEFRVILGSWTTRAEAESAGHALELQSVVKDWQVVPLSQTAM